MNEPSDDIPGAEPPPEQIAEALAEAAPEAQAPVDPAEWKRALRLAEAMIFASDRPVPHDRLQPLLPEGIKAREVFQALLPRYEGRGVELAEVAGGWVFRTAPDLALTLTRVIETPRRLPRVAMETLAVIAYHQPVTRAEIEEIRGASLSQNTLDALLELGLIAPRGRKEVPGRPSLWATTTRFLEQFGLKNLAELPRREELLAGEGPGLDLRGGGGAA
ncbi:SMC-Scp complex subunit ScpB [Acetobacteraceae bacterium H6797]|nr:SMC-Scp complex subunit ScpB [Acetobacteraceae bacterium H6797]